MTLDKAIEILTMAIPDPESITALDLIDATQLGIEALTLYRNLRQDHPDIVPTLLHGETPNVDPP